MSVKSPNRACSFELLYGNCFSDGGDVFLSDHHSHRVVSNSNHNRKRKNKKKHKKSKPLESSSIATLDPIDVANGDGVSMLKTAYGGSGGGESVVSTVTVAAEVVEAQSLCNKNDSFGELRQRTVNGSGGEDERVSISNSTEESGVEVSSTGNHHRKGYQEGNLAPPLTKLETVESLDWKSLMAKDPNNFAAIERSPIKYFLDEMYKGNSLRSTTTLGSEKEREKVYDTIFRLPWRCELLINVGFMVCLDSFLALLTVMPTRIVITLWRLFRTRQFDKLSADELSDLGCLIVLVSGVTLLGQTDISLIYHMIRGQGTIKLYVVYNVLEIFDKLFQSFGGDVLETLFNSAEGLASSSLENRRFWLKRFISDQALAMAVLIVHSFILLAQAVTLSTCIVAHNNALFALLVSNNFAEIKSNVFKRFSRDNIHSLVYADSIERFHMSAFLLFVLAQNILEAEGPWFESFLFNALLVFLCEVLIDIIKHSFLAKFNDIKPLAYSEFLEELCNQTLDIRTEKKKRNLTFVPLAPACVVIRVLSPVYGARLPCNPLPWRWFWTLLLCGMTYTMLTSLKLLTWISLEQFATWYIRRCQNRRNHLHAD